MNDRAVSTAVTWALTMLITTLLLTGLLAATGGQIESRTESVTRAELEVIGQRVVTDLSTADRLAATDPQSVSVRTRLPPDVAAGNYRIAVEATDAETAVVVRSGDTAVRVPMANRTAVANASVPGGNVRITLDGGALEVSAA